jgi:hypothetical protein
VTAPSEQRPIPAAPVHPLAALVTIVLDAAWGIPETGLGISIFGWLVWPFLIALIGGTCFIAVTGIQRYVGNDSWRAALAKGFAMAVLAGVPWVVGGTLVGALLLGWSGLSKISGLLR